MSKFLNFSELAIHNPYFVEMLKQLKLASYFKGECYLRERENRFPGVRRHPRYALSACPWWKRHYGESESATFTESTDTLHGYTGTRE